MKASWLLSFVSSLENQLNNHDAIIEISLHYRANDCWKTHDVLPSSSGVKKYPDGKVLNDTLSKGAHHKITNQKRYLIPFEADSIVVDIVLSRFPRGQTLPSIEALIHKIREDSQHKFDALHDSLTGCKNRKSFDTSLRSALEESLQLNPADLSLSTQGASSLTKAGAKSTALVTLDIDFFKRVNDTYGHNYGDKVLKSFSWLVDDWLSQKFKAGSDYKVDFFRLGGEEFNILITGDFEDRTIVKWMDELREHVQASVIPSNEHLSVLGREGLSIPLEAYRRITSSFGVATITVGMSSEKDLVKVGDRLKSWADKALYSAKQSGRNRVRLFSDIVKQFGQVIEYDKSVGVITIDIGSEVEVVAGQEFFVFPSKYTGDVDYIMDDGRSKKRMGTYPRIKIAKIVAFDVQQEISFCNVKESIKDTQIEVGSLLESIPLGNFGGLSEYYGAIEGSGLPGGVSTIIEKISAISEDKYCVIAVQIQLLDNYKKLYGPAKANDLLALVNSIIVNKLPKTARIVQIEVGYFGAAFVRDKDDISTVVSSISSELALVCHEFVDYSIGYIDSLIMDGIKIDSGMPLKKSNIWDYAVIANAYAYKIGKKHVSFTEKIPSDLLRRQNESREYDKTIADSVMFKQIGIIDAQIENIAGIANFSIGDYMKAGALFKSALELDGNEPIHRSNYAVARFMLHNYYDAFHNMMEAAKSSGGVDNLPPEEYSIYAYSAYQIAVQNPIDTCIKNNILEMIERVIASDNFEFVSKDLLEAAKNNLLIESH